MNREISEVHKKIVGRLVTVILIHEEMFRIHSERHIDNFAEASKEYNLIVDSHQRAVEEITKDFMLNAKG